jgi:carbon-monoxide dehydrogenase small subunit
VASVFLCAAQHHEFEALFVAGASDAALDDGEMPDEYARGEQSYPLRINRKSMASGRFGPAPAGRYLGGPSMPAITMKVNGQAVCGDVEGRTLLVEFLRDKQGLTGTHVGCDTSQCGACVVHVDGKAIKSCTALAIQFADAEVTTIEGLAKDGKLHPMQEAFREHHGLQCGFCTPGMIMAAVDIVNRKGKNLDEATIRHELEGNICRCTGYHNIVAAVKAGAAAM